MLLQGIFVPLPCPFYRDGASYLRKLEHNVRRYSLGPVAGLVALAPGSEGTALTDVEAYQTLQTVGESAAKEKVLVAGIERSSVHAALKMAEIAHESGFDAVLLAPPPDWPQLARKAPSLALPLSAVSSLARHPNILGLMDRDLDGDRLRQVLAATAEVHQEVHVTTIFEAVTRRMLISTVVPDAAQRSLIAVESLSTGTALAPATSMPQESAKTPALKTRTRSVGFQVLTAGATASLPMLLGDGASGAMPAMAACAPQGCFEVYAAWKDGDLPLAAQRGARLRQMEELTERLGPAALKYASDWNGYYGGNPRLPRLPLTAEQRRGVETALGEVRN